MFDGGYGVDYVAKVIETYNTTLPDSKVTLNAVQEIATQLQPRFVAGNPPDLIHNSGKAADRPAERSARGRWPGRLGASVAR